MLLGSKAANEVSAGREPRGRVPFQEYPRGRCVMSRFDPNKFDPNKGTQMETRRFSEYGRGILHKLLIDAYSGASELIERYSEEWKAFDSFVYDNLSFMDEHGFITIEDNNAIGFMSWDPR